MQRVPGSQLGNWERYWTVKSAWVSSRERYRLLQWNEMASFFCLFSFSLVQNDVLWWTETSYLRKENWIEGGILSNVNKHELVYGESSSNARDVPDVCLSFVLLFTIFIFAVTQKLVLQQSKNVRAKCTETLSPPPSIQFSLVATIWRIK